MAKMIIPPSKTTVRTTQHAHYAETPCAPTEVDLRGDDGPREAWMLLSALFVL
jgi:hypothetical protein